MDLPLVGMTIKLDKKMIWEVVIMWFFVVKMRECRLWCGTMRREKVSIV